MKWSEQMRVLNSEDEHYNQLVYDIEENALYLNEKLIATLNEQKALDPNTFLELKGKYPYIDDKNFLLNCLFKLKMETTGYGAGTGSSNLITGYFHPSHVEYNKSNMGSSITVLLTVRNTDYHFVLITEDNEI